MYRACAFSAPRRAAPQSYRKNTGKYSTTHSSENKAIFHRKSLRLNGNGGTGTVSLSETSIVQTDGPRHSGQPGRGGRPPNRLSPRPTAGVRRQVGTGGTAASRAAREVRERETKQLENLLQEIHRFDLIEKHIVQYRRDVFCGCETRNTGRNIQATPVPHTAHKPPPLTLTPSPRSLPLPHNLTAPDAERSASTRLQPDEKRELHKLLKKYVPLEVIRNSKIWNKFSCVQSLRLTKSTEYMEDTTTERDVALVARDGGWGASYMKSRSIDQRACLNWGRRERTKRLNGWCWMNPQ
ncbi:hypothetical protein GBAR_LOCUS4993 [Geodia barretti]|uniref:Uncharacterized protein n=1 Tax=Geodia barretti TaxID=519541 RepID=A0AA35W4B8_GEOBA|nr:hypothetical protein GBAR_LOCUS4993 [Geodia barretti]